MKVMTMATSSENTCLNRDELYPKVLICSLSRINKHDTSNNSLLLKNLFADWPHERLAQVYSGGSNGDEGFCKHQYQIAARDRQFGKLFFKFKGAYVPDTITTFPIESKTVVPRKVSTFMRIKSAVGQFVMDSGLYEIIFKLMPSKQLIDWVEAFDPDIILAQGYNLSFTWLPLLLKRRLKKPMAFYCSDDWPSYLYASRDGLCAITAPLMRRIVKNSTQQLITLTNLPFSFNDMMGEEYERRYGKKFTTLMHCDSPERFQNAVRIKLNPPGVKTIIAAGAFWESRWPQLLDLEEVCDRLNVQGIHVQTTVFASQISFEGIQKLKECRYVTVRDDPGHDKLPSYLKGADLLFLPETFDPIDSHGFRYSISTKAHLFMFSQQPILVYGHPACGLVAYARREGWARVVDQRNIDMLETAIKEMLTDEVFSKNIVSTASALVMRNSNCYVIRQQFLNKISNHLTDRT